MKQVRKYCYCTVILENIFHINPIALRKAKIVYNFGLSECSRVKGYGYTSMFFLPFLQRGTIFCDFPLASLGDKTFPLIQEGQLSVTDISMCTKYWLIA